METPYAEIAIPLAFSVPVTISVVSAVGEAYGNMMERLVLERPKSSRPHCSPLTIYLSHGRPLL